MENDKTLRELANELYDSCIRWNNLALDADDNEEFERYENIRFNVALAYHNVEDAYTSLNYNIDPSPVRLHKSTYRDE